MVDTENGLRSQARAEVVRHYASLKQAEELGTTRVIILASDTVAHAYSLARANHHDFVHLPELHPGRYDEETRKEILEQAAEKHRLGLLQIFMDRGVSKETAESLVDQEIIFA